MLWKRFADAQQPVELIADVLSMVSSGNVTMRRAYGGMLESDNKFSYSRWTPSFRFSRSGSDITLSATDPVGVSIQLEKQVVQAGKNGEKSIQGQALIKVSFLGMKAPLVGDVIIAASSDVPTNVQLSIDLETSFSVPANGRSCGFFIGMTDCIIYFCQMNVVK